MNRKWLFYLCFFFIYGIQYSQSDTTVDNSIIDQFIDFYSYEEYSEAFELIEAVDSQISINKGQSNNNYAEFLKLAGNVCLQIKKIPSAISYYKKSLRIRESIGSVNTESNLEVVSLLAKLYISIGDFKSAEPMYHTSLEIAKVLYGKSHSNYYVYLNNLAGFYFESGNYKKALELGVNFLNYLEQNIDEKDSQYILGKLCVGLIYLHAGERVEGLEIIGEILPNLKELEQKSGQTLTFNLDVEIANILGIFYYYDGNLDLALHYFLKLLFYFESGDATLSLNPTIYYSAIATIYKRKGDYEKALLYQQKRMNSVGYFKDNNSDHYKDGMAQIGYLLTLSKEFKKAKYYYLNSIKYLNNDIMEKQTFMSETEKEHYIEIENKYYSYFNSYVLQFPTEIDLIDVVYNNTLFIKNLLLNSTISLKNSIKNSEDIVLKDIYDLWLQTIKEISLQYEFDSNGSYIQPTLLIKKADSLEKKLVNRSKVFDDFQRKINISRLDVQKQLKKGEVAIEFFDFDFQEEKQIRKRYYCALIIKPSSVYPKLVYLFDEKEIYDVISSNKTNEEEGIKSIYGTKNTPDTRLYDLIWKPLEKELQSVNTIYYAPSGILTTISFDGLRSEQNGYMIDDFDLIRLSTTANLLSRSEYDIYSIKNVGLIGGIDYKSKNLEYESLEGTKKEVQFISSYLKSNNIDTYLLEGSDATKNAFFLRLEDKDILHIATHGYFEKETVNSSYRVEEGTVSFTRAKPDLDLQTISNPLLRTGLIFAPENEDVKGNTHRLSALEISQLNLEKTKLVVLSACESGLGDIKGYQGVYGLQRSFKLAGADQIIMSLWKVPDIETQEFMEQFYISLFEEKNISKAFKKTQLKFRTKYDPYYWAAFVLLD